MYIYVHVCMYWLQQPRVYEVPVRQETLLYGRVCVRIRRPALPAVAQTCRPPVKAPPGGRRPHFRPSNPASPRQASPVDSKCRLLVSALQKRTRQATPPERNRGDVRNDVANGNDVTIRRDVIRGHCDLALAWVVTSCTERLLLLLPVRRRISKERNNLSA